MLFCKTCEILSLVIVLQGHPYDLHLFCAGGGMVSSHIIKHLGSICIFIGTLLEKSLTSFEGEESHQRAWNFEQTLLVPSLRSPSHHRRLPAHHLPARRHQGGRGQLVGALQAGLACSQDQDGGRGGGQHARTAFG